MSQETNSQQLFIFDPAADVATPLYGSVIAGHVSSTNKAVHYSCSNSSQYSGMQTFHFLL